MRSRLMCFLLSVSVSFSLLAFSGGSIDASAALANGRFLTPAETVALIGNRLDVEYYNGTDIVSTSAVYLGEDSISGVEIFQVSDYLTDGRATIVYSFSGNVVNDPNYIAVDFHPQYALMDVDQFHTIIGVSASGNGISSSVYQTPQWIWNISGERTVFEGRADYGLFYRVPLANSRAYGCQFSYVEANWSSQSLSSAYSQRAVFSYATPYSEDGRYYIAVGCPYITSDGYGETVTTSGGGGGGGTDINVSVDMTETNGILDSIKDILGGIVSGIGALFLPSDNALSTFWDNLEAAIMDKLDPLYTVAVQIDRVFTNIRFSGADTTIHVDGVTFNVGEGQTMTLGDWDVPIIPDIPGNSVPDGLVWTCKHIISIVCTLAFINMCKNKIDIFLNPESERAE